jgi:hypothetical protein
MFARKFSDHHDLNVTRGGIIVVALYADVYIYIYIYIRMCTGEGRNVLCIHVLILRPNHIIL